MDAVVLGKVNQAEKEIKNELHLGIQHYRTYQIQNPQKSINPGAAVKLLNNGKIQWVPKDTSGFVDATDVVSSGLPSASSCGNTNNMYLTLSNNKVLHLFMDSSGVKCAFVDTTNNLLQYGAITSLLTHGGTNSNGLVAIPLSTDKWFIGNLYYNGTDYFTKAFILDCTSGSPIAGVAVTLGTSQDFSIPFGKFVFSKLSSTSLFYAFKDKATTYPKAVAMSVSGNTISVGAVTTLSSQTANFICTSQSNISNVIVTFRTTTPTMQTAVINVSGTNITVNTFATSISSSADGYLLRYLGPDKVLYASKSTVWGFYIFSFSGNTFTSATAAQTPFSGTNYDINMFDLATNKFLFISEKATDVMAVIMSVDAGFTALTVNLGETSVVASGGQNISNAPAAAVVQTSTPNKYALFIQSNGTDGYSIYLCTFTVDPVANTVTKGVSKSVYREQGVPGNNGAVSVALYMYSSIEVPTANGYFLTTIYSSNGVSSKVKIELISLSDLEGLSQNIYALGLYQNDGSILLKGVSNSHSGLTPGKLCYFDSGGNIVQSATSGSTTNNPYATNTQAGMALSSTEILVKDYLF